MICSPVARNRYGSGDGTQFVYQARRGVGYTVPREFSIGAAKGPRDPDADISVYHFAPQSVNFDDADNEYLPLQGSIGLRFGENGTGPFEINARILWDDDTIPGVFLSKTNLDAPSNTVNILLAPQLGTPLIRWQVYVDEATAWEVDFNMTGYAKDVWHDFRITRDDVTLRMFMDSVELSITTFLGASVIPASGFEIPVYDTPLSLGVRQYKGGPAQYFWSGNVQDLRFSYTVDGPFDQNRPFA